MNGIYIVHFVILTRKVEAEQNSENSFDASIFLSSIEIIVYLVKLSIIKLSIQ